MIRNEPVGPVKEQVHSGDDRKDVQRGCPPDVFQENTINIGPVKLTSVGEPQTHIAQQFGFGCTEGLPDPRRLQRLQHEAPLSKDVMSSIGKKAAEPARVVKKYPTHNHSHLNQFTLLPLRTGSITEVA